jgi:hypothetical protein
MHAQPLDMIISVWHADLSFVKPRDVLDISACVTKVGHIGRHFRGTGSDDAALKIRIHGRSG